MDKFLTKRLSTATALLGAALALYQAPARAADGLAMPSAPQLAEIAVPLPGGALPRDMYTNMNDLLEDLEDPNPAIRKAAVRGSKGLIFNSKVYRMLCRLMMDEREPDDIRLEAARMLSYAAAYDRPQLALRETARYTVEKTELRAMAYKSLWSAAEGHSRVREFLMDSANYAEEPALRRAAIWALFRTSRESPVRNSLLQLLGDDRLDEATRIEVIKSLYGAMNNGEVHKAVSELITGSKAGLEEKKSATLALSGAAGISSVHRFLEKMAYGHPVPELRDAAAQALSPSLHWTREYFHLSYLLPNGEYFNPIELE